MVSAILLASFDLIKFLIVCTSFLFLAKRVRTHTIPLLITCLTMTVINIIFRVLFVSFGVFNGEILALYLSDIILFGAGFLFMQWIVKKESKKIQ